MIHCIGIPSIRYNGIPKYNIIETRYFFHSIHVALHFTYVIYLIFLDTLLAPYKL